LGASWVDRLEPVEDEALAVAIRLPKRPPQPTLEIWADHVRDVREQPLRVVRVMNLKVLPVPRRQLRDIRIRQRLGRGERRLWAGGVGAYPHRGGHVAGLRPPPVV